MTDAAGAKTLVFLFADVEGSTRLFERLGDGYVAVIREYHARLRRAVAAGRGWTVGLEGDGHFACFPVVSGAVDAAVASQRSLAEHEWPEGAVVRARMGIHIGEAVETDAGLVGLDIHRAARIAAAAHGGQVLVSAAVAAAATSSLPAGVALADLGEHRLKDLSQPERIFQLDIEGLPSDFPAVAALPDRRHNLPVQLTSFVGREGALTETRRLLERHRLVTLVGTGGSGKTRLAVHLAAEVANEYADGVWLVDLTPAARPADVTAFIASALDVAEEPGEDVLGTVCRSLERRNILLVLDNCEHVVAAAAHAASAILAAAPGVRLLVTTRQGLRVAGEVLWQVPPLETEAAAGVSGRLPAAVELFVNRAQLVRPDFSPDAASTEVIRHICVRLDGLPLAVELAAARLGVLSLAQIAAKLDDAFRLLTTGPRDGPQHHGTLRAAIDWSHELLGDRERVVFRRAAVFRGGFTLPATEAVCAGGAVGAEDLLDVVAALVEASMLAVDGDPAASGEVRYRMLETVRRYALDRLSAADESVQQQRRHAGHYLGLAREGEAGLAGADQADWIDRLDAEHANLRAALAWAAAGGDADVAVGLAGCLGRFWYRRGYFEEARGWLRRACELAPRRPNPDLAKVLRWSAAMAAVAGDTDGADRFAKEESAVARALGDDQILARSLNMRAGLAWQRSDLRRAADAYEEALDVLRSRSDPFVVHVLNNLGLLYVSLGRLDAAHELVEELERRRDELAHTDAMTDPHRLRGDIAFHAGDVAAAWGHWRKALAVFEGYGARPMIARARLDLAAAALAGGDIGQARRLAGEARDLLHDVADRANEAEACVLLGRTALAEADLVRAAAVLGDALAMAADAGQTEALATALSGCASLALGAGDTAAAAMLHGAAGALRERIGLVPPAPHRAASDEEVGRLRTVMGAEPFARATADGRSASPESALEVAESVLAALGGGASGAAAQPAPARPEPG